jgi:hypothetical protein
MLQLSTSEIVHNFMEGYLYRPCQSLTDFCFSITYFTGSYLISMSVYNHYELPTENRDAVVTVGAKRIFELGLLSSPGLIASNPNDAVPRTCAASI